MNGRMRLHCCRSIVQTRRKITKNGLRDASSDRDELCRLGTNDEPLCVFATLCRRHGSCAGTDQATPPIYTYRTALTYAIGKQIQLDAGIDLGLDKAAPRQQILPVLIRRAEGRAAGMSCLPAP
jgi:hypothetical protein